MVANLLTYVDESDAPEDTLTESQVWALRQGIQATIDRGDESLSLPSRPLSSGRWHHWGLASLSGSTTAASSSSEGREHDRDRYLDA